VLEPLPWHQTQWQLLNSAITGNKLHHALLLTGPEGIGLEHFANLLAARLLCHQPVKTGCMCGECKSCILFRAGNHPDLMLLEPEEAGKQLKVELIRELIVFMQHTNQYGRKKIAIINPAEAMNRSAANSLLKTLEEPPPDSLMILISHQPSLLPVTIRSRCQRINFPASNTAQTVSWLEQSIASPDVDVQDLLEIAQGAPLKVLDMLDKDPAGKREILLQDLKNLRQHNANLVNVAETWLGFGTTDVLRWLLLIFHQMTRLKLLQNSNLSVKAVTIPYLQALTNELDLAQLVSCYDETLKHYQALTGPYNLNQQGILEDLMIYWQSLNRQIEEN
jgi:DNA polymerase-3 subunit delta'